MVLLLHLCTVELDTQVVKTLDTVLATLRTCAYFVAMVTNLWGDWCGNTRRCDWIRIHYNIEMGII